MSKNTKHIATSHSEDLQDASIFSRVEIPFEKSKADVWDMLDEKIEDKPGAKKIRFRNRRLIAAMAASFLILIGTSLVMRFYTITIKSDFGEHLRAELPDNSSIELNAESSLSYHPYWWKFSRKIDFSGEGYFQIAKGSKLEVASSNGKTIVLGTSFNIYNRDNLYKVTCLTGKVKVVSVTNEEAILTPDYHAEVDEQGNILVNKLEKPTQETDWTKNMFSFTAEPIMCVFNEIERQYDVKISVPKKIDYSYTGYFPKSIGIEQTLNLVCKPFGLTFVKKSGNEFLISQK